MSILGEGVVRVDVVPGTANSEEYMFARSGDGEYAIVPWSMYERLTADFLIYCPTCGSCGEDGCCSPDCCVSLPCLYGKEYKHSYEELLEENKQLRHELEGTGYNMEDFDE